MPSYNITGKVDLQPLKKAVKEFDKFSKKTDFWAKHSRKAYLAVTAAASYYAQKVLRDSIKNAMDDERSQRLLALTLQNVASATDAATISAEAQINKMQMMYGITDDLLRPALARLARSTGNTSAALYDLQLALDISAATGKSLEAVTNALGKAEDRNVASLQRLGLGLDASLLKTKDTKKIFEQLRATFRGFAAQEAQTTEAKFRRIGVAADEAKEIIGTELVHAIDVLVSKKGSVDGIGKSLQDTAQYVADLIAGTSMLAKQGSQSQFVGLLKAIARNTNLDLNNKGNTGLQDIKKVLDLARNVNKEERIKTALLKSQTAQKISLRNAEMAALKATKEAAATGTDAQKKTLEQLMAEEAARKAGFKLTEDLDSIQTVAAAKRLEESRQYKASVIDAAQTQFEAVKRNYDLLNSVWETQKSAFDVFLAYLKSKSVTIPVNFSAGAMATPAGVPSLTDVLPQQGLPSMATGGVGTAMGQSGALALGGQTINVTVNAGAIGSEEFLVGAVGDALTKYTRLGNTTAPAGFF